jgi:hypothetical protein
VEPTSDPPQPHVQQVLIDRVKARAAETASLAAVADPATTPA